MYEIGMSKINKYKLNDFYIKVGMKLWKMKE